MKLSWYRIKSNFDQRGREGYVEVCLQASEPKEAEEVFKRVFLPKGARFLNFEYVREVKHQEVGKWQQNNDSTPKFPNNESNEKIRAIEGYNERKAVDIRHRSPRRSQVLTMHRPEVVREQKRQTTPPVHSEALSIPQENTPPRTRTRADNISRKAKASKVRKSGGKEDRRYSDGGRKKQKYSRSKSKRDWAY